MGLQWYKRRDGMENRCVPRVLPTSRQDATAAVVMNDEPIALHPQECSFTVAVCTYSVEMTEPDSGAGREAGKEKPQQHILRLISRRRKPIYPFHLLQMIVSGKVCRKL